ncbi:MAG: sulfite exporter TauE/SafE family protein [Devosiaceae bacterium]|nr:sulfite exporter TauE/SafE family protein [Devosiaceae bacterium MH13]
MSTDVTSLDSGLTATVLVVFFLAGVIKGTVGFGMPLFALTVLAVIMPLTTAIAANVGPSLITNLVQAVKGPYLRALFRRLWPFLVPAIGLIGVGIAIQVRVDPAIPGLLLGLLALAFAAVSLAGWRPSIPANREGPLGFAIGLINGVVTGVTGVFIIPGGLYIQSLGLKRDELVQALGLLFFLSTATIGALFVLGGLMTRELAALSALAIVPALIGQWLGERLRRHLSEALFRKLFLVGIATIGVSLIVRNGAVLFT